MVEYHSNDNSHLTDLGCLDEHSDAAGKDERVVKDVLLWIRHTPVDVALWETSEGKDLRLLCFCLRSPVAEAALSRYYRPVAAARV